ncbi:MAG: hypothetical protein EAZ68_08255 [Oscillatoriales cyanobacterium]|nr:MAG: hypothetical protein EAZ68_08255 [Oscillatoriales cyanobacterium]
MIFFSLFAFLNEGIPFYFQFLHPFNNPNWTLGGAYALEDAIDILNVPWWMSELGSRPHQEI